MKFIYRGTFSKGLDTEEQFGVTFKGRKPSEVTEVAAVSWMLGHPDYEAQAEVVEAIEATEAAPVKKARKVKK
jgi:hypothetical protein